MNDFIGVLRFYLQHFYTQDFLLLIASAGVFFLFVVAAIFLRKWPTLAVFTLIAALIAAPASFYFGEQFLAQKIRPHELQVNSGLRLAYSHNIYFDVRLRNKSERQFSICRVKIRLLAPSKNRLEQLRNYLRPLEFYSINLHNIAANTERHEELVLRLRSGLRGDFETRARAVCF